MWVKTPYTLSSKLSKNHSSKKDLVLHFPLSIFLSVMQEKNPHGEKCVTECQCLKKKKRKKSLFLIRPAGKYKLKKADLLIKTIVK